MLKQQFTLGKIHIKVFRNLCLENNIIPPRTFLSLVDLSKHFALLS